MLQEHKAMLDWEQARENASISRETLQEHKAILNCKEKRESKGSNFALPKV
jgi:hypothetical protein